MSKKLKYIMLIIICQMLVIPYKISAYEAVKCGNEDNGLTGRYAVPKKIPEITSFIVTIMEVAIPVIIVILGMIDLIKAITAGKEDELKKSQGVLVKRLIAGALVFFIFAIAKLIVSVVNNNSSGIIDCMDCFINGSCL